MLFSWATLLPVKELIQTSVLEAPCQGWEEVGSLGPVGVAHSPEGGRHGVRLSQRLSQLAKLGVLHLPPARLCRPLLRIWSNAKGLGSNSGRMAVVFVIFFFIFSMLPPPLHRRHCRKIWKMQESIHI